MTIGASFTDTPLTRFQRWLTRAKGGEKYMYWRGHLGSARSTWIWEDDQLVSVPVVSVNDLAHGVLMASEEDEVFLLQRRVGAMKCEYFAVKRRGNRSFL